MISSPKSFIETVPDSMVRVDRDGPTAWLVLDRPDRLNAFTRTGYQELRSAVEEVCADDDVRVVVLTGTGRAFSAGADRSLFDGSGSRDDGIGTEADFRALVHTLGACPKPIIAAVNGLAVGFGSTVLLHCDLVVAAASARFRFPFTELEIVPEAASSVLLPSRAASSGDAAWALLSSEWLDAETAVRTGLVWRVVPDVELTAEVGRVAATLAGRDPAAVAATKRLMAEGRTALVDAAMDREQTAMAELLRGRRRR